MMKSLVESKWFPLIVVLLILITGIAVAFCCGFRITYAPELENSWEAISAVASWASVCATLAAVWAAIQIPRKIAEQKNNIQLINIRTQISNAILGVSSRIWIISNLVHTDIENLNKDMLWRFFSFATMDEYRKYSDDICLYDSYFEKHRTTVSKFHEVYLEIAWNIWYLELGDTDKQTLRKLSTSLTEADELIKSKEFDKLKAYMKEIINLCK